MKKVITRIVIAIAIALCGSASHADVSYKPKDGIAINPILIHGTISVGDTQRFLKAVKQVQQDSGGFVSIRLNSNGGDVNTALEIGRQIRSLGRVTSVGIAEQDTCVSSCVFILAGGPRRSVSGAVGIHRPYAPSDTNFTQQAQKVAYEKIGAMVVSYLREMNIPESLWELMFRIPPEKMRYLTVSELQQYGLSENDPYFNEAQTANSAKHYGISKVEYLQREARSKQLCYKLSGYTQADYNQVGICVEEVMRGQR
jgi:hypothetical protein